jgi:hypothetical protein
MTRNESGFVNHETKPIFLESGFVTTIRNESMDLRNESTFLRISYTRPVLYDSHILINNTSCNYLGSFFIKSFSLKKHVMNKKIAVHRTFPPYNVIAELLLVVP